MKRLKNNIGKTKILIITMLLIILVIPIWSYNTEKTKLPSASFLALAGDKASFKLEMPEQVQKGQEFEAKLYLNDVDAFTASGLFIKYDTSKFEFLADESEASYLAFTKKLTVVFGTSSDGAGLRVGIGYTGATASKLATDFNGELATLKFRVKDNAAGGTYDFKLQVEQFINDEEEVDTNVTDAKTTISVAATGFSIGEENIEMLNGDTKKIEIKVEPEGASTPANTKYSVSGSSVQVDASGTIKAIANGKSTITIQAYGFTKTLVVNVVNPIEEIEVAPQAVEMKKGENKNITATLVPHNAGASITDDTKISWSSSNDAVASVTNNGVITAHKGGTAVITAKTGNGKTATVNVTVVIEVESFDVKEKNMTIYKGTNNAQTIITEIEPVEAKDLAKITWKSSNPDVAVVDETGKVTGLKAGSTVITGTLSNGMNVKVNVTVEIIPLKDLEVEFPNEVLKGKENKIVIKPEPTNTTELESISYESSDTSILKVDEEGNAIGLKAGAATITIKAGDITKEIEVTVKEVKAEKIEATNPQVKLGIGEETEVSINVLPNDYTEELTYTYETSNPEVVTVDEAGKMVGIHEGSAQITVKASNGLIATIIVNVTKVPVSPQTGLKSSTTYLIIAGLSLVSIGLIMYLKKKCVK